MPAPASAKGKVRYVAHRPEPMPLHEINPEWDEVTQAWLRLENCAIQVFEDLGLEAFGGTKIQALRMAVVESRRAQIRMDAKELMRIAIEHDNSEEAKKYVAFIRDCVKKIPPEREEQFKARKGKK